MKEGGTSAAHCFRFLKRKNLEKYSYKEVPHQDGIDTNWPELEEDPDDIICLTKQYIASIELSQPPFVACPARELRKLDLSFGPLKPLHLADLGDRARKELSKSAVFF